MVGHPFRISSGPVNCDVEVTHAVFGDFPIHMHTSRDGNKVWIDIVLYNGKQTQIDFTKIPEAAIIFTLSLYERYEKLPSANHSSLTTNRTAPGLITANWRRPGKPQMSLTVPTKPMPSGKQKAHAFAKLGSSNPWKYTEK
jgi:hypothetical protein